MDRNKRIEILLCGLMVALTVCGASFVPFVSQSLTQAFIVRTGDYSYTGNLQAAHVLSASDVLTVQKGLLAAHLTSSGTTAVGSSLDVGATGTNLTRVGVTVNTGGKHGTSLYYDGTYGHLLTIHSGSAWKSFKYEALTHLFYSTGTTLALTLDSSGNAAFEKNVTSKGDVTLGDGPTDVATVTGLMSGQAVPLGTISFSAVTDGYGSLGGVATSANTGIIACGAGSILGMTGVFYSGTQPTDVQIRVNGTEVMSTNDIGTISAQPFRMLQAKGTDTVADLDIISVYVAGGAATGTVTVWGTPTMTAGSNGISAP